MKKVITILCVCIFIFAGCQNATAPKESKEQQNDIQSVDNNLPLSDGSIKSNTAVTTDSTPRIVTPVNDNSQAKLKETLQADNKGIYKLKFKNTTSDEVINSLNGKKVSITGYISTLSPLNGEFAYLMNMPYQSCPYCVPGTSQISNTLAIFAGNKSKIKFTDQPVTVEGTLETGDFTDNFGYQYSVRLNNVTVNKADIDTLSAEAKKYNLLAENGIVNDLYGCISTADYSIYYDYYELENPSIIDLTAIDGVKEKLKPYNNSGDYDNLMKLLDSLKTLGSKANTFIEENNYTKVKELQKELDNVFYSFSSWISEGEL